LDSRNIYNRIDSPLTKLPHLDLLHAVRRLWKNQLPDCALGSAEEEILKVQRSGDIPGYLIPHIYFEYLQTGNPNPLKPIFYHNQQDILSMIGLLARMIQIFENPLKQCMNLYEVLAVAKVYESSRQHEDAIALCENYLKRNGINRRREVLFRIGFNYKKIADWSNAARIWHECLTTESYHPLPYIELAKHYEHKENNCFQARRLVEKALNEMSILEEMHRWDEWQNYKDDLEYRYARLKKKTGQKTTVRGLVD
jgi:tetratricopeptide (TPR) repeat protein